MYQSNSHTKIVILTIFKKLKHIPSKDIESFRRTVGIYTFRVQPVCLFCFEIKLPVLMDPMIGIGHNVRL